MTEIQLARKTASILIVGHILLFMYGLVVAAMGQFEISDAVQMILMGTPLLTLVAVAGFQYVIGAIADDGSNSVVVDKTASRLIMFVVLAFLGALFIVYSLALSDSEAIDIDGVKFAVGAIETTLGAYIGIIREKLFPTIENNSDGI